MAILFLILLYSFIVLGIFYFKYKDLKLIHKRESIYEKLYILYRVKEDLANSIMSCYNAHILLAKENLSNNSFLKEDIYGHFRTKDLKTMSISEIYFTYRNVCKPLFYWVDNPDKDAERNIIEQYRCLIIKGIKEEKKKLNTELLKLV